jgi:hypothetical protein
LPVFTTTAADLREDDTLRADMVRQATKILEQIGEVYRHAA